MNKEHLFSVTKKDFKIDRFSGTGSGGQHRNKHQNCVRLHHKDSGVIVTGQSNKSYKANLKEAFENLLKHPKWKIWFNIKVYETKTNKTIEQRVEEMMNPDNIKIEHKMNGKWEEIDNVQD